MNHGSWKEMSSHPTNIANCTPHADKRLHGVHLARYVKSALELERCAVSAALKVILSHTIQQQRQQQHNSAIPPPQHPWGRFAHFGAKSLGRFKTWGKLKTRRQFTTCKVENRNGWGKGKTEKNKNRKRPFRGLHIPPFKWIHPVLIWMNLSSSWASPRTNPEAPAWCLRLVGGKISHFKCF